jgi:uncharacterized protein YlxP (DUF503 family)
MADWIPKYIRRVLEYKPHKILSAKEYNAILNLLVAQGDYNSEWLQYLYTEGIPNAVAKLTTEELQEALTAAVRNEIAVLANSITNKTSAYLNQPLFTFLDISVQEDSISTFRTLLESKGVCGTINACTGLIGVTAAYPTLQQLIIAQRAGHEIITSGTDVAELTADNAENVVSRAKEYMESNSLIGGTEVFLYPAQGNSNENVKGIVGTHYKYAINVAEEDAYVDSDLINRLSIPVVMVNENKTIADESVKAAIDNTVATNGWCILAVDTSSFAYSDEALSGVIDYVKAQAGAEIVSTVTAVGLIEGTLNNQLDAVRDALNALADTHRADIKVLNTKYSTHDKRLDNALYIESFDPETGTLVTRSEH